MRADVALELYDQDDLEKAQRLFNEFVEETGWDPSTQIIILGNTSYQEMRDISIVNKTVTESVGFNVDLQQPDWATAVTFRQDPEYWGHVPHQLLRACRATTRSPTGTSTPKTYGWHDNLEIEELKSQYSRTSDPAEQRRISDAVQKSYYENVTHMIPGNITGYNIINANVRGGARPPLEHPHDRSVVRQLIWTSPDGPEVDPRPVCVVSAHRAQTNRARRSIEGVPVTGASSRLF